MFISPYVKKTEVLGKYLDGVNLYFMWVGRHTVPMALILTAKSRGK